MTTVYGIPNCDTIKKTKALLTEMGVDFDFHDYKKLGCNEALAKQFLEHFGYEELINKRGTTWRKLADSVKLNLTEKSAIHLMAENSSLIKRPIIEHRGNWILGFDQEKIDALN
jgi:arsenate reductase (glutaredoxin)